MAGIIKVTGGRKLKGSVTPIPNKNSIVAALPVALLSSEDVIFRNVPATSDVEKILSLMKMMGAEVEESIGVVKINCKNLKSHKVDLAIGGQFRGSLMFVGPLLARFGIAEVPMPGGCELGMRSIEAHVDVFRAVGVKVERIGEYVKFEAPKKKEKNYRVWQIEASVTATENFAMYAAGVDATFELIDAACEPHVVDVLELLKNMGAEIEGSGSNRVKIKGTNKIKGADFEARPDFIDICGLIVAAAVTNGEIRIVGANIPDIVDGLIKWFVMFNIDIKKTGRDLVVKVGKGGLEVDVHKEGFPLAAPNLPKLYPRPWPGFPVDAIPSIATLASKSKGRLLLKNWMYESGLDFVRELNQMGADIMMMDPEKIIINGPVKFKGGTVTTPSVIQACKAIFLAALADDVTTTIYGVDILRRRYPNIFEVYVGLGAKIEVMSETVVGTKI